MKLERFYASSMYAQRLWLFFVFVSFALVDTCDVNKMLLVVFNTLCCVKSSFRARCYATFDIL